MANGATVRNGKGTSDRGTRPLLRVLALGVGPVVVVVGLGVAVQGQSPQRIKSPSPVPTATCTQPPVFKPGYQRGENYVIPQGQGFKFRSDSWIEADLCSAGTLKITADGELGGDEKPQLTVALNGSFLDKLSVGKEHTFELSIPKAGRLILGYFNDYYLADVRVASLQDVKFSALTCQGFESIMVPKAAGGDWDAYTHIATLVNAVPITFTPCSAGKLTMRVIGREGEGAFPVLAFKQSGEILRIVFTNANFQKVYFNVNSAPMTVTLTNPSGRTIADRNLNVQKIEFISR